MSAPHPHFDIFQDKRGEWRWRLRARNGRIIADSGEGYASKRNAHRAVATTLDAVVEAIAGGDAVREVKA